MYYWVTLCPGKLTGSLCSRRQSLLDDNLRSRGIAVVYRCSRALVVLELVRLYFCEIVEREVSTELLEWFEEMVRERYYSVK